jgi:putative ABC transport system permease protein
MSVPTLHIVASTLLMAMREIRRNTLRSSLTTLGIVIGVAAVIALVELGEGATQRVTNDISSMGVNMLTVMPGANRRGPSSGGAAPLKMDDVRAISRDVRGVRAVAPSASRSVLAVFANKNWNTIATGTTNAYFDVRGLSVARGRMFTDQESQAALPVCLIGDTVRRELFGHQEPIGATLRIARLTCRIIGLVKARGQSAFGTDQDDYVLLPISTFQRRISGSPDLQAVAVSADSEQVIDRVKNQIRGLMRERRHVLTGQADDFSVFDTREMLETLQSITGVLTALLTAVAAVSLVVGGIGIMNIMLVSVTERTREIGIRLAIGARGREVLLQFLVEAVVLCVLGGALGMLLGLGGSYAAAQMLKLPFKVMPQVAIIAFGFSASVGIVFGLFPALKAARMNPIEALRHE